MFRCLFSTFYNTQFGHNITSELNVLVLHKRPVIVHVELFNLKRLQAKSKVQTDVLDKLLNTDDQAENAKSETKMQEAVDRMSFPPHNQRKKD